MALKHLLALLLAWGCIGAWAAPLVAEGVEGNWSGTVSKDGAGRIEVEVNVSFDEDGRWSGIVLYGSTCTGELGSPVSGGPGHIRFREKAAPVSADCSSGGIVGLSRVGQRKDRLLFNWLTPGTWVEAARGVLSRSTASQAMVDALRRSLAGVAPPPPMPVEHQPVDANSVEGSWAGMIDGSKDYPLELELWSTGNQTLAGLLRFPAKECAQILAGRYETGGKARIRLSDMPNQPCRGTDEALITVTERGRAVFKMRDFVRPAVIYRIASPWPELTELVRRAKPESIAAAEDQERANRVMTAVVPTSDPADRVLADLLDGPPRALSPVLSYHEWLRRFAGVNAAAMGVLNLSIFFPDDPKAAADSVRLALEVSAENNFAVPGLGELAVSYASLARDFPDDPSKLIRETLGKRRVALILLMKQALLDRDPAQAAKYERLVQYLRSMPSTRMALDISALQGRLIVSLSATGNRLSARPRDDQAARLLRVTVEQIEFIIRQPTLARAQLARHHYEGVRRGVLAEGLVSDILNSSLQQALFCGYEPEDAYGECGPPYTQSCTRWVWKCP